MKIEQKAIEEIQNQFKCIGIDYANNKDVTAIAVAHGEMAEAVIKALEKQVPKEAKTQGISGEGCWIIKCPECETVMEGMRNVANYCCKCGQAIKWGD